MQISSIPVKFPIPFANSAGGGFTRPIPTASQIGIQSGAASLTDGFPPLCFQPVAAGGVPPFGEDFNGLLNPITAWNRWQSAGGPIVYDPTFQSAVGGYPQSAIIQSAVVPGKLWYSTVDNNTSNPDTLGANWTAPPGILPTGTPIQQLTTTPMQGCVLANGKSIGDASSGATSLASAAAFFLFSFVWLNFSQAECPVMNAGVVTARGANPAADWALHRQIQLPLMQGSSLIGADTMGGTATSLLSGVPVQTGNTTTPGSLLGENLHTLTRSETPTGITSSNTQTISVSFGGGNSTPITTGTWNNIGTVNESGVGGNYGKATAAIGNATGMSGSNAIAVTSNNTGGGSHNTVQQSYIVYWNLVL